MFVTNPIAILGETEAAKILESKGIPTTFEWTEGTHFGPILPRLDKALSGMLLNTTHGTGPS